MFDGDAGEIGVRPGRLLEIVSIGLYLLQRSLNPLIFYQVFTGKLAHAQQVRRPLWSFLQAFFTVLQCPEHQHVLRRISRRGRVEVKSLLCCLPLCATQIRGNVDPVITCSDASLEGLGVSRTIGLTPESWQLFRHGCSHDANTWTPLPKSVGELREPKVLSIGLFDGIGGLRRSLERLRIRVMLNVSVESDTRASRVVREAWPGTVEVSDIRKVTQGILSTLITAAYELGVLLVILAGGWPCQDVSQLNRHRVGVTGERSSLFREFIRVAQDAQSLAEARLMKFIGVR